MTVEEMIEGSLNGNVRALNLFYREMNSVARGVARRKLKDYPHLVNEGIQDSIIKIYKALPRIKAGALFTYAKITTTNHCIDMLRKEQVRSKRFVNMAHTKRVNKYQKADDTPRLKFDQYYVRATLDSLEDPDLRYDPDVAMDNIMVAVDKLSPAYKRIFIMYHMDEMTHEEIATELNITSGASKSNLHKAKRNLREMLGSYDEALELEDEFFA